MEIFRKIFKNKEREVLKKISIRGRFAFAMQCLESVLSKRNELNNPMVDKILNKAWTYIQLDMLDVWDEETNEFDPVCILDPKHDGDYKFLTTDEVKEIRTYFLSTPTEVQDLFSYVIEIGAGNLYGGTGEYSKYTLEPTMKVIEITKKVVGQIPDLAKYQKFSFADDHGWGHTFSKSDLP